jgi:hypothetical protein
MKEFKKKEKEKKSSFQLYKCVAAIKEKWERRQTQESIQRTGTHKSTRTTTLNIFFNV